MGAMSRITIDRALRERLADAGSYPRRDAPGGGEIWFSPHLNQEFAIERVVKDAAQANAVLRRAGMEEAF